MGQISDKLKQERNTIVLFIFAPNLSREDAETQRIRKDFLCEISAPLRLCVKVFAFLHKSGCLGTNGRYSITARAVVS